MSDSTPTPVRVVPENLWRELLRYLERQSLSIEVNSLHSALREAPSGLWSADETEPNDEP